MHVAALHSDFRVVFGKIFGHAFGERSHQDALAFFDARANLVQKIVNLSFDRTDLDFRVDQPRGPNDLLDYDARRFRQLVRPRRRRDVNHLIGTMLEFLEGERTVIECGGQPEAVFHQCFLTRAVTGVHTAQLRHGLVRFVDEHQVIAGEIIQQSRRRLARHSSGEMARIIFNAVAVAHHLNHFQIKLHALVDALCFDGAALFFQLHFPPCQFFFDGLDGGDTSLVLHYVVRLGINRKASVLLLYRAEERVDLRQRFHLISPQLDAVGHVVIGGEDLDHIAAHAKCSSAKLAIGPLVEDIDQFVGDVVARNLLTFFQKQHHAVVSLGRAQTIDAAHRSDDQRVATLK